MVASSGNGKRTRGPHQGTPWVRTPEHGLSVLRLAVDVTDPVQRHRVEAMFSAAFSIRRALQHDARARCRAYRAAHHERKRDGRAVRERLGLSRSALEHAAYDHLDAAPHLRRSVTKALVMHLADSVWSATERHLFRDATGARHGLPRPGGWFDFARIPGRARSHTTANKWETFRLHGSLAGHRAAYNGGDGHCVQPHRLRPIAEPASGWWRYRGPLAVVFTGLPIGTLVLPVRLPAAPCNQPILDHHLADPSRWHKLDLVRHRDPTVIGGWRYEAHLMVLTVPYVAPAVHAARVAAALDTADRRAGIDVNVSNLTVASHADGHDLRITRVAPTAGERQATHARARRKRRRQRRLDRSRRARNPSQYALSSRQQTHAERRAAAGLPPIQVIPAGPRIRRTDGKPVQAYRRDALSASYRRERAAMASDAERITQARRDLARQIAARLVREHGMQLVIEDCDLRPWARRWGRGIAAFAPGTLVAALGREAASVAALAAGRGGVVRAATRTTALSQHCLCGARVTKTLGDRTHVCPTCDLRGQRDAVAAALGACVVLADPAVPGTAEVDRALACTLLAARFTRERLFVTLEYAVSGRQDVRSESSAHSARDGWSVAEKGPTPDAVAVARRIFGWASFPTLDETSACRSTTPDRVRTRANLPRYRIDPALIDIRDSS